MARGSEVCAFWDFARQDWNSDGCTIAETNDPEGIVKCQCNHLTNFAVLVVSHISSFRVSSRDKFLRGWGRDEISELPCVPCFDVFRRALGCTCFFWNY